MILGIDLGSSSFKTEVYDSLLNLKGSGEASVPYVQEPNAFIEMPVPETEEAFRQSVSHAVRSAEINVSDISSIGITSQAQTFTICSPDGDARVPFISWQDTRGAETQTLSRELVDFADHSSLHDCDPLLMVSKLSWLQDNLNGNAVLAGDTILMLPTWFVHQLTGVSVVDSNIASMSGLYSFQEHGWWRKALEVCGVVESNCPYLVELGAVAGTTNDNAHRFGIPADIPVVLAGNDQTAGAFGADIHNRHALLVTLGTAQVVYTTCDDLPDPHPGVMRGPYPGQQYYQLVADEHGAGTVARACEMIEGCENGRGFDQLAMDGSANESGVEFVAHNIGGHWKGETTATTDAEKAHAVLACLVDRMFHMIERLGTAADGKSIILAGGGSHSSPWRTLLKRRLGRSIEQITSASPALGAALLAAKASVGK